MTHCMLAFSGFQTLMAVAIFAVCLLLILIILVQKGRGGGLASAFGGGGGGGGAFGAKTGDVFTGITVVLAGVYLLLTVCGNYVFRPVTAATTPASIQSQQTGGTAPTSNAPGGAAPATSGATGPKSLPPGAIKLNTDAAKTSIAGALEKGKQVAEDAASKTSDAVGEVADDAEETAGEVSDALTGDDDSASDEQ